METKDALAEWYFLLAMKHDGQKEDLRHIIDSVMIDIITNKIRSDPEFADVIGHRMEVLRTARESRSRQF